MTLKERYLAAKRVLFDKVYGKLNSKQREAIYNINGPLLILAGAGSGKTTVLVKRIAYIIKYGNAYHSDRVPEMLDEERVIYYENAERLSSEEIESNILPDFIDNACPPYRMLAITFTNKAAKEIKNRLANAFGVGGEDYANEVWAGTFHSICVKILHRYADRLGYTGNFSIYDVDDSKSAVASAMKRCGVDEKQFPIKSVMNTISRAKDSILTPEEFESEAASDFRQSKIAPVYREYQNALKQSNALDFDDIIMQTVLLLRNNADVREYYQGKFLYVCVDEYQDTNKAQFELTCLLSGKYRNLMVVGDDDQSIYKFRGATIQNILGFDHTYSDATVVRLEQNYRSTQAILDAANVVVSNNKGRKGKTLWTAGETGEKITLHRATDQNEEARFIVDTVYRMVTRYNRRYSDFAVLYRTNAQSRELESAFGKSGIPYRLLGGTRFNDRKEIRDVTAYLQLVNNHGDNERLLRIINEPKRQIGAKAIEAISAIAFETGMSLFEVIEHADKYTILSRVANQLKEFARMINKLTAQAESVSLPELYEAVITDSGYKRMLIESGDEKDRDRLDNVNEFKTGLINYVENEEQPTLAGFLETYALVAEVDKYDDSANAVVLMTIHSAKGLEFPIVFLPGMEENLFPGIQTICGTPDDMEEERRLAYVALTRAKEKIYILHTKRRVIYGQTMMNQESRFVDEIPDQLLEKEDYADTGYIPDMPKVRTYLTNGVSVPGGKSSARVYPSKPTAVKPASASAKTQEFNPGDFVMHGKYGRGEVLNAKRMGSDIMYEIMFDEFGTKKMMASYAHLKKAK